LTRAVSPKQRLSRVTWLLVVRRQQAWIQILQQMRTLKFINVSSEYKKLVLLFLTNLPAQTTKKKPAGLPQRVILVCFSSTESIKFDQ
jgi:hypothetical protein